MKTLLIGWMHLKWSERAAIALSIGIACGLSVFIGEVSIVSIGALALMSLAIQSTMMTGVMRFRSKAMNHLLTTCLEELREVRANPGQPVPTMALDMVAQFLGDKK